MIDDIKTMRIGIDLTPIEYDFLRCLAFSYGTTVNGLLSQFVADLTSSNRSGGSDERQLACDWLFRYDGNGIQFPSKK